ncbi:hypothetical protein [Arachidicoccus terrestris]|uniref:hypothetical protein n=1 Tax=Arachidicoccus terrestris TaxID=2875539 RepID=UPI001CC360F8|nr:hypothetical protein [Arachidicoccus terrestris]UAY55566.1 hypothetical protein K9M52_00595 [Arachidicoccus terrestris]
MSDVLQVLQLLGQLGAFCHSEGCRIKSFIAIQEQGVVCNALYKKILMFCIAVSTVNSLAQALENACVYG